MQDTDGLISGMAERLFVELATPAALARHDAGEGLAQSWARLDELGLPLALIAEENGGPGIDPVEALGLVRLAGRHALPLPLGETMLANRLLTDAGLPAADGVATLAAAASGSGSGPTLVRHREGWHLAGRARRVPWARHAATVVVIAAGEGGSQVASVPIAGLTVEPGQNLANEPRDDVGFDLLLESGSVKPAPWELDHGYRLGAALRAIAMAGVLGRVLEETVAYAGERVQFGKPIARLQAIQQSLAAMAGHVAAAGAAADLAAEAIAAEADLLPIAAAKVRIGEAAGAAAAIAHQVHGAIGFTREHGLNHLTRRLWAWRDEFGGEAEWSLAIGRAVIPAGADGLWPLVTAA